MNLELLELLYLQTRNQADHSRQGASDLPVSRFPAQQPWKGLVDVTEQLSMHSSCG